ncbi:MAG: Peptide chain release factor 2 @ programmed frameshift-containing [uncultured Thermomicrobiales bacterium]|uniref:Peptide chain release factor 2 n=1 Tax=uncultured Thermomicrobiales bacterium TaxID=1645740 RepID=A0A6J4UMM0_9BACT|nr:MAG: Peptide chain release factor 2 @ programmed frameshift-containing [uncultured Thermomicrobiales bacterium]
MPGYEREIEDLEHRSGEPGFWDDPDAAQRTMRHLGELKARVGTWQEVAEAADDLATLAELAESDPDLSQEVGTEADRLSAKIDGLELQLALSGPHDASDAILVVHSGGGGIDAQDWASMLVRMYLRWGERHGFKADLLDSTDGEEAGIKNATMELRGPNAYGLAKSEGGSHRLVRLSPFDAAHRRHTAFALVEVMPEIDGDGDGEIAIGPDDVRVDTFRSSGAGGQHVNKTDSAVRLTHLPTGIVVTCQNERSQIQNRESAFKILRARLLERRLREEAEERARLKGEHTAAGFGNRIRSYVLHPYTQVTDHRTDTTVGDAHRVLDGDIDPFIDAFLQQQVGTDEAESGVLTRTDS